MSIENSTIVSESDHNKLNPKQVLFDLAKELDGNTIEDDFEVFGKIWTLKLLNEEESNWRNANLIVASRLTALSSLRLPTLAMSIRKIDGISVYDFFANEWMELSEDDRKELENMNKYSKKYFVAEKLMEFLSQRIPDAIDLVWEKYQELEKRREESQGFLKK